MPLININKLQEKLTIGRKDQADFPELDLKDIDIKMDTGAYTSSIHCHHIEERTENGKQVVVFQLLDPTHPKYQEREFKVEKYREKLVKNSFGTSEKRFVIFTDILLFGEKVPIQLSLSRRGEMRFPVLLGRRFLMGKFVVDTALYNLSKKKKKKSQVKSQKAKS